MLYLSLPPTREYLNFQADRIERVLASHRVPIRVHGSEVSPRWIRFALTPHLGARISTVRNLSEELALALGAQTIRVAHEGESFALEMPRPDAEPIYLFPLLKGIFSLPPLSACLGVAEDGRPLLMHIPSPDVAHVLVAGATGSGKTELMRTMLVSLALANRQSRLQIALIDPKRRGFVPLVGLPHLVGRVAFDPVSTQALLERLVTEMERRERERVAWPHIVVAVDDLLDVLDAGGRHAELALLHLAQRGREVGLYLILGTQRLSSTAIGSMLQSNFPVRLVGRVGNSEDARIVAGVSGTGAEKLIGQGDFLAVGVGQAVRFQAAWISTKDWGQLALVYYPQRARLALPPSNL